jgi:hypothetical protein
VLHGDGAFVYAAYFPVDANNKRADRTVLLDAVVELGGNVHGRRGLFTRGTASAVGRERSDDIRVSPIV